MDLSVLIATWNRCERLAITLDAIARCRIPAGLKWEVVLIANGCTDRTAEVAASFFDRMPLVYLEEPQSGKSRALNRGLAVACGQLLVFTDDDIRPCPDWLATYWSAFCEWGGRYYFGGPVRSEYEGGQPPEPELLPLAPGSVAGYYRGEEIQLLEPDGHVQEANWACPADAVQRVGGYDSQLGLDASLGRRRTGEGEDLIQRLNDLGIRGVYLPDAWVFHFVPETKCRLEHFAQNSWAHGVYSLRKRTEDYSFKRITHLKALLGEEQRTLSALCRLCFATIWFAARWAAARFVGRKAYADYIALYYCLGRLEGYRQQLRQYASAAARSAKDRGARGVRRTSPSRDGVSQPGQQQDRRL